MANIVTIKNLVKSYGDINAVDNMTINITEGEIFGLLGPNGAGKSTTINMLCGIISKEKGQITCFGKDHDKELRNIKKDIGIVPQEIALYDDLKAIENVKFFAALYGLKGKELNKRANEALEFVGLVDRKDDFPKNYSGGMKRRLNIACAIAHRPKLIIMDEPTVGIDPQSRNHILQSVKKLNKLGSTVIYTTHYMEEVEAICTKIAIMDHGKLIALGSKEELQKMISDKKALIIETDIGTEIDCDAIENISGVTSAVQNDTQLRVECLQESNCISGITAFMHKSNFPIRSINMGDISLESVFLSLTGRSLRD